MPPPNFTLHPATPEAVRSLTQVQFDACSSDPGFQIIFPHGPTAAALKWAEGRMLDDISSDPTCHVVCAKESSNDKVASWAGFHLYESQRTQDSIDEEMLVSDFGLPTEEEGSCNVEAGNRLIKNGVWKRHEVMGILKYAYLATLVTRPEYQGLGAGAMLLKHFTEVADSKNLAAYVEATPVGLGLYQRYGFEEVDRLRLDLEPWKEGDFWNICMVRPARSST